MFDGSQPERRKDDADVRLGIQIMFLGGCAAIVAGVAVTWGPGPALLAFGIMMVAAAFVAYAVE